MNTSSYPDNPGALIEKEHRILFESLMVGIAVHGPQGELLRSNPQAEVLLGLTAEQMAGKELIDPDWHFLREDGTVMPVEEYPVSVVLRTRKPHAHGVIGVVHKEGAEVIWLQCRAHPIHLAEGGISQIVVEFFDITDRKRAKARMQAAEEQYRLLFENSMDAVLQTDPEGRIHSANAAAAIMFGLSVPELLDRRRDDFVDTSDPRLTIALTERAKAGFVRAELTMIRGNGQKFEAEVSSCVYRDSSGLLNTSMTVRDITHQRAINRSLHESELRLGGVIESAMDAIVSIDDQHCIILFNKAAQRLFGYEPKEVVGLSINKLVPQRFHELHETHIASFGQTGASSRGMGSLKPISAVRANGEEFPIEASISKVDVEGRMVYTVILRDVTERQRAQEVLNRANAEMAESYRRLEEEQRNTKLVNTQLEVALDEMKLLVAERNKAEFSATAKGDFLASMSHEIRTPLNAMVGMAYLALKSNPSTVQKEYLEKIRMSGEHLASIINDILDLSKIEAGKLDLETANFDLHGKVADVLALVEDSAREKQLVLHLQIAPDVPRFVIGDSLRLGQILINYLNNAVKFSKLGNIFVRLRRGESLMTDGAENVRIHFEVEDCGTGMTQERLSRLFQSFEQGDQSITRRYGGTGLGLSICKKLATLMGGEVGATSQLGKGSIFWFSAELKVGDGVVVERALIAIPADVSSLKGRNVLVVDDNDFNQEVAKSILVDIGVHVALANDGQEALNQLNERPFDCVLMDVQMPMMDGLTATRRIRSNARTANTVVIGLTANALTRDTEMCIEAGMNAVLTKPFDPQRLFEKMASLMGGSESSQQKDSMLNYPIWDIQLLIQCVGDNVGVHRELLNRFQSGARTQAAGIASLAGAGNYKGAGEVAHKLKSSARTVGAMRLGQWCELVEKSGNEGHAALCLEQAQELASVFFQTDRQISQWLHSTASAPAG